MPNKEEPSASLKALVEAVEKDSDLRVSLFKEPAQVAAKFDVKLRDEEVAQLKRVGELMRLVAEFTAGRDKVVPGPIFYPIDIWWKRTLGEHVLKYRPMFYPLFHVLRYHIFYHIFYPIGYPIDLDLASRWSRPGGVLRRR